MGPQNAGDAAIEKLIDGRGADIRHACGDGETKTVGNAAHGVNRLWGEQTVFTVQVDEIETAEHADDLDGLRARIDQTDANTLFTLPVFRHDFVHSKVHDVFLPCCLLLPARLRLCECNACNSMA